MIIFEWVMIVVIVALLAIPFVALCMKSIVGEGERKEQ